MWIDLRGVTKNYRTAFLKKPNGIKTEKCMLRRAATVGRRELSAKFKSKIGLLFVESFFDKFVVKPEEFVAGYWPIGSEVNIKPLMDELDKRNCGCLLPVVRARGEALHFHKWQANDKLVPSDMGILEPSVLKPKGIPSIMLVPLLAFDEKGNRLGYGGGFYDRTIKNLRSRSGKREQNFIAVGIGYAGQIVENVPHDALDQRMDWIITEEGAFKF